MIYQCENGITSTYLDRCVDKTTSTNIRLGASFLIRPYTSGDQVTVNMAPAVLVPMKGVAKLTTNLIVKPYHRQLRS